MLFRYIYTEIVKMKRSTVWLSILILPLISVLFGSINFYFNQGVLKSEWYSLWTQVSLFYGEFFLPILIAICCAYICRFEHMNKNWNMVMTLPSSPALIYISKLIIVSIQILLVQIFLYGLYTTVGFFFKLSAPIPPEIKQWLFRGWFATISVTSLQLTLSLRIKSFSSPIGLALCFVFIGLGMYVLKLGMLFPHSLLTLGMNILSGSNLASSNLNLFYIFNILFIVVISSFSIIKLKHSDVRA